MNLNSLTCVRSAARFTTFYIRQSDYNLSNFLHKRLSLADQRIRRPEGDIVEGLD